MKIVIVLITISIVSRMTRWHNILEFSFILCILCFMRMVIAPAAARNPGSSIIRQNKDLPPIPTQANDLKASFFTVFQLGNTPMLLPSPNVSANCFNDSIHYVNYITEILFALTIHQKGPLPPIPQWAITMMDATGKVPTGLLQGNLNWLGSFSECLAIRANGQDEQEAFRGQYCTLTFENTGSSTLGTTVSDPNEKVSLDPQSSVSILQFISVGICWPSSCQNDEIALMLHYYTNYSDLQPNVQTCQIDAPKTFDAATIAIIAVYSVFGVLMLIGTVQELMFLWKTLSRSLEFNADNENAYLQDHSDHGILYKFLLSFSVYKNGKKLLATSQQQQTQHLTCIHGLRFISMLWVILGHTYDYLLYIPLKDPVDLKSLLKNWMFNAVLTGTFAVDTFFLLRYIVHFFNPNEFKSGFLATYLCLKEMKRKGGLNFFYLLLHRFWRLTPPLAMVVALIAGPYYLMGSGPQWPGMKFGQDTCRNYWWKTLLYINNLYDTNDMCIEVSWYLAVDMQFFIVGSVIVIVLYHIPILGLTMMGICFLITTLTPTLYIYYKDIPGYSNLQVIFHPSDPASVQYSSMVYIKPYCRMGPYLVGMFLAYFLYKKDTKVRIPKLILFGGWLIATTLGLALVYGNYGYYAGEKTMSDALNAIYGGFATTAWGLVVAWVLIVCVTGQGGFVNTILSWKPFMPLGRLSYFAYLLHLYVILLLSSTQQTVYYLDQYLITLLYCGIVVITLAVSTVATLAFEVPMIELEKLFLPSGQRKPSSVSNNRFKSNVADDEKCDQLSVISSISGEHAEHIEHDAPSGCFHNGGFDSNDDDDLQNLKKI